jgi:hypothetical protein
MTAGPGRFDPGPSATSRGGLSKATVTSLAGNSQNRQQRDRVPEASERHTASGAATSSRPSRGTWPYLSSNRNRSSRRASSRHLRGRRRRRSRAAAAGSAHHQPNAAFASNPTSSAIDRNACTGSVATASRELPGGQVRGAGAAALPLCLRSCPWSLVAADHPIRMWTVAEIGSGVAWIVVPNWSVTTVFE